MNQSLYTIQQNYIDAINGLVFEENDIEFQQINDTLTAIQDEFKLKAINVASYIKNTEFEIEALKKHEDEIKKRRIKIEKRIKDIGDYLKLNMIGSSITSIKHTEFDISLRMSPPSVEITNSEEIPTEYLVEKITVTPDKIKIKNDLKNGVIISGVNLTQSTYISIK